MIEGLGQLLKSVMPLALGAAISPTLLILQLVTLTSGRARLARSWLVAAGSAVALTIWGTVGWLLLNRLPTPKTGTDPTEAAVDLTLALVLIALGVRAITHQDSGPPVAAALNPAAPEPVAPDSGATDSGATHSDAADSDTAAEPSADLARSFGLGAAVMAANLTSLVLFLPAIRQIVRADSAVPTKALVTVILFLMTLLTVILPPLAVSLGGSAGQRALNKVGSFVDGHRAAISATVCCVFALYLAWSGLTRI